MSETSFAATADPGSSQDIFVLLLRDHNHTKMLFAQLQSAIALDEKRLRVRSILHYVAQHERAEDEMFWPAVREALPDREDAVLRCLEQERESQRMMDRIQAMDVADPTFESAVAQWQRAVLDHADTEETLIWPAARTVFDADRARELGSRFTASKGKSVEPGQTKAPSAPVRVMENVRDTLDPARFETRE